MKVSGPDSLHSWFIALCCSFLMMVFYGITRMSGVFFVASMSEFNVNRSQASLPYVLSDFTQGILSPFVGWLAQKFSIRVLVTVGSLIAAIGAGLCCLAKDILTVTVLWGCVYGAGFGFSTSLLSGLITEYFVVHRSTALGVVYFGSYFGFIFLPGITELLLSEYDLSGTFLFMSGCLLQCVPVAMLLKNTEFNIKQNKFRDEQDESNVYQQNGKFERTCDIRPFKDKQSVKQKYDIHEISEIFKDTSAESTSQTSAHRTFSMHKKRENTKDMMSQKIFLSLFPDSLRIQEHEDRKNVCSISNDWTLNRNKGELSLFEDNAAKAIYSCSHRNFHVDQRTKIRRECPRIYQKESFPTCANFKNDKNAEVRSPKNIFSKFFMNSQNHSIVRIYSSGNEATLSKTSFFKSTSSVFELCTNPVYVILNLTCAVFGFSFIGIITVLVDFSRDIGIELTDEKYLLTCYSSASCIGLVTFGWVTDYGYMKRERFAALCFFFRCISLSLLPFSNGLKMLICILSFMGFCEAALSNMFPLLAAEYTTEELKTVGMSSIYFLSGISYPLLSPLIGCFRDNLGSYTYLFHLFNLLSLISGVILFLLPHMTAEKN